MQSKACRLCGEADVRALLFPRRFCRIFTEMAVSYMSMLLDPLPMGQEQLAALVLKCAAHPDPMINSLTLDFWSYLTSCIDR